MTDQKRAELIAAGLEYDEAVKRMMGNEGLLERVLRKFVSDPNHAELEAAMQAGNWTKAEEAAHALKGIAGNLGFAGLCASASELMTLLRGGQTDGFGDLPGKIREQYDAAMSALEGL